ncbi:MAG: hypothetical protein AAGJ83_01570 [Planctomycetota bacterium]
MIIWCLLIAIAFVSTPQWSEAAEKEDVLEDLKCFIMPKRGVKGKKVMDYKGAKLYLCCSSCVKRMTKTPEKYEAKANHQLLQTGQFVQNACPTSGDAISDASPVLEIGGVKVKFSSEQHKDVVAQLELEVQLEKVFGAKGFKMGKFVLKVDPKAATP